LLSEYKFLAIAIFAWATVQLFKFISEAIIKKEINFRRLVETGGMPSSHSATVTSLATAIGMAAGFNSAIFAVAFIFSIIVMYDAAGVRLAAGKQAAILNEIINSKQVKVNTNEKLKELLGHTPIQVFVGALYGIIVAVVLMNVI
jgi:acid phosphatase family membrane protein YuiD